MRRAAPRQLAVAALVAVLLAACGGQPKPVGEAVQTGGQLIIGGVQEAKGFHPYLGTDAPSIDYQALHWKVTGIAGRKPCSYRHGGSGHQAVGLAEGHTPFGKLAPPPPGLFALDPSEWSQP